MCRCFTQFCILLGDGPCDNAPEDITNDNASNSSVGFLKCCHSSQSDRCHHFLWDVALCQLRRCFTQETRVKDCPKELSDAPLSSRTDLLLHLFEMSSNCAGTYLHRGGKGHEAASGKCPTLVALHLVSGSRSSTLLVWLHFLLPLGWPPELVVVLTTILPSARDGELSPLDSRHHFCLPRRRLRDCATAPCIAHSRENSIKVTQSPALNAANLSSNLLRGMRPPRGGLQSNILGNNKQFPSTCGGLQHCLPTVPS